MAETNAPPRPKDGQGIKAWFTKLFMKKAGAGVPSANRITLLRDADGDGVAEVRLPFAEGLNSPFGMVLIGSNFYVANADAIVRFSYTPGQTRLVGPPVQVAALPGGPINHHWTKNLVASADGSKLYVSVGSNSNVGRERHGGRAGPRRHPARSIWLRASAASSPRACATRSAWPGSRAAACCGPWSTSATNWATTWCPTT